MKDYHIYLSDIQDVVKSRHADFNGASVEKTPNKDPIIEFDGLDIEDIFDLEPTTKGTAHQQQAKTCGSN